MIGLITPPVGIVRFVVMQMTGVTLEEFTRESWPFLVALILVLLVITYWPAIVLVLPNYFMGS